VNSFCKCDGPNKITITRQKRRGYGTCYGRVIATYGEKHIWRVKIKVIENYNITIGVSNQKCPSKNVDQYDFSDDQMGYAYDTVDGEKCHNCISESYSDFESCVSGDVIIVCLDLRNSEDGTLSFGKNETDHFVVAFHHLDTKEQYRLAVSLWLKSHSVTIQSHECL